MSFRHPCEPVVGWSSGTLVVTLDALHIEGVMHEEAFMLACESHRWNQHKIARTSVKSPAAKLCFHSWWLWWFFTLLKKKMMSVTLGWANQRPVLKVNETRAHSTALAGSPR